MVRLKDIAQINQHSLSAKHNYQTISYLDTGSIVQNKILGIQEFDLTCEKIPSRAKRCVRENSILFSTVRPNQNHYGILEEQMPENFVVSTGFCVIDVNPQKANPYYVYYYLTQQEVVDRFQAIAEQSVSTYPSIKPSDLAELEMNLPAIDVQNQVVSVIKALDDKLLLNDKINDYLSDIKSLH